MSVIYVDSESVRLKSYGASTRGAKTVVKIELEVTEPYALAGVLRDLAEIDASQRRAALNRPAPRNTTRRRPQLLLTHRSEED